MRKLLFALFIVSILLFSVGCSKEDSTKKLSSRPVQAKPIGEQETVSAPAQPSAEAPVEVAATPEVRAQAPAGRADCEMLLTVDMTEILGGVWAKTNDCPQRPAMPKGVDVCQCSYDGPKQVYVNVETQLYTAKTEANRVYDMYCKGATEDTTLGEKSCKRAKTSALTPNYIYFLKGNYFVKLSCLGGSCPEEGMTALAQKVAVSI